MKRLVLFSTAATTVAGAVVVAAGVGVIAAARWFSEAIDAVLDDFTDVDDEQ